jgi:hypothetical protein
MKEVGRWAFIETDGEMTLAMNRATTDQRHWKIVSNTVGKSVMTTANIRRQLWLDRLDQNAYGHEPSLVW